MVRITFFTEDFDKDRDSYKYIDYLNFEIFSLDLEDLDQKYYLEDSIRENIVNDDNYLIDTLKENKFNEIGIYDIVGEYWERWV